MGKTSQHFLNRKKTKNLNNQNFRKNMTNLKTYILFFGLFACNSNVKTESIIKKTVEKNLISQKELSEIRQSFYAQKVFGEYWYINKIIGNDMQNTQEFTLNKIELTSKDDFIYGNKIIFNNDNTFNSNYSAPCGNDCFPSSTGTFKIIDKKHIKIFVKEFIQVGDCENKKIELNIDLGTYYISKESNEIIKLIKSN